MEPRNQRNRPPDAKEPVDIFSIYLHKTRITQAWASRLSSSQVIRKMVVVKQGVTSREVSRVHIRLRVSEEETEEIEEVGKTEEEGGGLETKWIGVNRLLQVVSQVSTLPLQHISE